MSGFMRFVARAAMKIMENIHLIVSVALESETAWTTHQRVSLATQISEPDYLRLRSIPTASSLHK